MQDTETGEMVEVKKENDSFFSKFGLGKRYSDKAAGVPEMTEEEYAQRIVKAAERSGFCILSVNQIIDIKGKEFKVVTFKKKQLMLEPIESGLDIGSLKLKYGETLNIHNGRFSVETWGTSFLRLRGMPATSILNQNVLDEMRKKEILAARKQNKDTKSEETED